MVLTKRTRRLACVDYRHGSARRGTRSDVPVRIYMLPVMRAEFSGLPPVVSFARSGRVWSDGPGTLGKQWRSGALW